MSLILDALRGRRDRSTPRPDANAAQTDAVLATLGYGRFSPTSPFNRLKRIVGFIAIAIVVGVVLWGGVIWVTQAYLMPDGPAQAVTATPISTPAARPTRPAPRATAPPVPVAIPPVTPTVPTTPVPAPVVTASPRQVPPRSASPPQLSARPDPARPAVQVQASRRPEAPDTMPVAPTGTPSDTALSMPARTNSVSQPDDHFALAVYNQRIGNFEEALVHYRAVLQRDELNAEAHNNLGLLYRDKGLLADAAKELQRAIAINPRYARAHNNLGVVYLSQKKLDSATAEFREVLSVDPRNIEALVNLAVSAKEAGHRDEARVALTKALELDPRNPDAHYNLALVEDEAGNGALAVSHYKSFLQYGAIAHADLMAEVRKRVDMLNR